MWDSHKYCSTRVLYYQCVRIPEYGNSRVPNCQSTTVLKCWSSKVPDSTVPDCHSTRVPQYQGTTVPVRKYQSIKVPNWVQEYSNDIGDCQWQELLTRHHELYYPEHRLLSVPLRVAWGPGQGQQLARLQYQEQRGYWVGRGEMTLFSHVWVLDLVLKPDHTKIEDFNLKKGNLFTLCN